MKATRQSLGLCLVIGMTIVGNIRVLGQGNKYAHTASYIDRSIPISTNNEIRELTVGDKVPNIEFELVNYATKKAHLSNFKGKYLILDFWATWCTSCVKKFPRLDSIQTQFQDKQLQVLLVNTKSTGDDEKKVSRFFEKRKENNIKGFKLISIVNDSLMNILFPHKMVPHYVWVDNNGTLQAITSSEQITQENIERFLNGKELQLPLKKDITIDFSKPLFANGNGMNDVRFIHRSFLTGYLDGFPGASGILYDENRMVTGLYSTNVSKLLLVKQAYTEMDMFDKNRIVLNVKEPSKFNRTNESWDTWKHENALGYQLITPATTIEKARKLMQEDLKRYFNVSINIEKRDAKCYVLKIKTPGNIPYSNGGTPSNNLYEDTRTSRYILNMPISVLVKRLNNGVYSVPVIDETGTDENVDLRLPNELGDFNELKSELNKYGFDLIEKERLIDVFVVNDKM